MELYRDRHVFAKKQGCAAILAGFKNNPESCKHETLKTLWLLPSWLLPPDTHSSRDHHKQARQTGKHVSPCLDGEKYKCRYAGAIFSITEAGEWLQGCLRERMAHPNPYDLGFGQVLREVALLMSVQFCRDPVGTVAG